MYSETYLFKSEDHREIIVNDGSGYTQDFFEGANVILSGYSRIDAHPSATICPDNYEEDAFEIEQRRNFRLSDWLLVALEMDEDYEPQRALLMNKYHQEDGLVFDFVLEKAVALFYRYFSIQETPDSPILLQKDFLESIGLNIEQRPSDSHYYLDDEDEEEVNYFDGNPLPQKAFTPNRKTSIPNFGGAIKEDDQEDVLEEDEELEDVRIEIQKPSYTPTKKTRPQNLHSLDRDEEYEKEKARKEREAEEEELEDLQIEVSKPKFTPASKGKPKNLDADLQDAKYKRDMARKKMEEERKAELISQASNNSFKPNNNTKPDNLDANPDYGKTEVSEAIVSGEAKVNETPSPKVAIKSEEDLSLLGRKSERISGVVVHNNYKVESSINIRPDVRHHEASLINNPKDKYSSSSCHLLYKKLKEIRSLRISANCLFVPEILPEEHEIFSLAKEFKAEEWLLLALIHDAEEKPLYTILSNKKDENLAILVSFKHRDPRIMVISTKGISLNDPAYPFYSYRDLLSIAKGESPYAIGENENAR